MSLGPQRVKTYTFIILLKELCNLSECAKNDSSWKKYKILFLFIASLIDFIAVYILVWSLYRSCAKDWFKICCYIAVSRAEQFLDSLSISGSLRYHKEPIKILMQSVHEALKEGNNITLETCWDIRPDLKLSFVACVFHFSVHGKLELCQFTGKFYCHRAHKLTHTYIYKHTLLIQFIDRCSLFAMLRRWMTCACTHTHTYSYASFYMCLDNI